MIFSPDNIAKILAGTKTQTRRVVKSNDWALGIMFRTPEWKDQVRTGGRVRWRVNGTYAVQPGRGERAVCRIRVTAICYCERAEIIVTADARAEGFASIEEFQHAYAALNGVAALMAPCWALSFVRVEG